MRAIVFALLACSGCVGLYAEAGAGLTSLDPSGSGATVASGGVNATYMFSVGLDSDFAHISQFAMGVGSQTVHVGNSSVSGTATDWRIAGALKELSVDQFVVRFASGLTVIQDLGAKLDGTPITVVDVYFGPGVTVWKSETSAFSLFTTPRYMWLDEGKSKNATWGGWGAEARLRYTWLFGDSHWRDAHPLER